MFSGGFGGFNFGGFGGQGHEEDDDDSGPMQQETKDVDTQELYTIMGIDKKADVNEIKKAYRKACLKGDYRHPDKGGDPEKFKKLSQSYEVLSDPEKREVYDKYGLEGLKEGGGGAGGNPFDIFENLFGGGGGGRQAQQRKAKAKQVELNVTLEEVYTGKMAETTIKRKRTCETCDGKGGKNAKTCDQCKGQKVVIKLVRMGPNAYSQTQAICDKCNGKGDLMKESDRCKTCNGSKIVDNEKVVEVPLEPGVPHEYSYKFTGEADEAPGIIAGDLYVKILIKPHNVFVRKGADLYIEKKITLLEALAGVYFEVKHLNGSTLKIATPPGTYIENHSIHTIEKQGMPFFKDSFSHGNIYVKFTVEFPKSKTLKAESLEKIKKELLGAQATPLDKSKKFEYLADFFETDLNPNPKGGNKSGHDDEDEDGSGQGRGGQRVQCAQQ